MQDPVIGRFISADPYIDGAYDTQGWNRYSYVQNRALSMTDPSGFGRRTAQRDAGSDGNLDAFEIAQASAFSSGQRWGFLLGTGDPWAPGSQQFTSFAGFATSLLGGFTGANGPIRVFNPNPGNGNFRWFGGSIECLTCAYDSATSPGRWQYVPNSGGSWGGNPIGGSPFEPSRTGGGSGGGANGSAPNSTASGGVLNIRPCSQSPSNSDWSFNFGGYYGPGFEITGGQDDGRGFVSIRLGLGSGAGVSWSPNGTIYGPAIEDQSSGGFVFSATGALKFNVGPLGTKVEAGLARNFSNSQFNQTSPVWSLGGSARGKSGLGLTASGSVGVNFSFYGTRPTYFTGSGSCQL